ncbi:MAG: acetyl-CoA carboxylase biotin carboxylase subunit [Acidobacteria bacterium]|nr:acetyl-CoA carboxylase biotin carboxylase subunit [Acidobacteriota bacterium]
MANRGEIAVRILRACREAGLGSVAVYSQADTSALHVRLADHAVAIGPARASESYLSVRAIIDAARAAGADAVHPGYGFLSESPELAAACADAGLTFVGPPADVIERMGSKIAARATAERAGVPVVPGQVPLTQDLPGLLAAARAVGYPLLVKPAAGGGGIGMKRVAAERDLEAAALQARREAQAAFGDDTLFVERLVSPARHVEFQVLADAHGDVVHLFERECSVQRRHQKVIEESPSTALTPSLRATMGAAACALAREAGYRNAGTVEFLVEGTGDQARFFFLEMNTRLQVEHPVTELVTGIDLVRAQLRIAAGEPLPWRQEAITQRGHAIEARVYAEDPARGFLPQSGPLLLYREPSGPGIRVDSGVCEGQTVSVHYDPLLAKLIASGDTREAARRRALLALRAYPVLGIATNVALLTAILEHPAFLRGEVDTAFLDREAEALVGACSAAGDSDLITGLSDVVGQALDAEAAGAAQAAVGSPRGKTAPDPWTSLGPWRV